LLAVTDLGHVEPVKPGLRLQILLLLGGLMVLAFLPLFFAVATYTGYTLQQLREEHATLLGRSIAAHVADVRRQPRELSRVLADQTAAGQVIAIGVYDTAGEAVTRAGQPAAVDRLPRRVPHDQRAVFEAEGGRSRTLGVAVSDADGWVVSLMNAGDDTGRANALVRLVGLYTGLVALGLLVLAYFALTRFIVQPLDRLSGAAERVAGGARRLDVPRSGARELLELSTSLRTMTDRLISEEEALKRQIDEVERATVSLKDAQDQLIRSERLASFGRLAAGLAHEIGNPIAALIGFQDLLLAGGSSEEEQRDFLQRMRRETERINQILRDLLQFARPTASTEPGSIEAAVYDTAALVAPQRAMQDVDLQLDVYPDLPLVRLSREQLVQVVLNLVLNAADACGPGGRVSVRAKPHDRGVQMEIEDSGPGVLPEVRERLFEPFVTTKEVGKGTGLGLAVCRGLVESAGGTITLDTSYTAGARFVIELPPAAAAQTGG
jgi:signal transduction histidine kinase